MPIVTHTVPILQNLRIGIIAGGRSTRWGGEQSKCLSDFNGQAMVCSALARLSLPLLGICIRPEQLPAWQASGLPYPILQEHRSDLPEGPLKGIHCLLSALDETGNLMVIPCDMPLLNDQVLAVLWQKQVEMASPHPLVLTTAEGKHTPVCLLSRQQLGSLEAYLLAGNRKLIDWLRSVNAIAVPWLGDQQQINNLNHRETAETLQSSLSAINSN